MNIKEAYLATIDQIEKGYYINKLGGKIDLRIKQMFDETILYHGVMNIENHNCFRTHIEVLNQDTFEVAKKFSFQNVCVLNMASSRHPGGMISFGHSAQEEMLCARSTLIYSLCKFADKRFKINYKSVLRYDKCVFVNQNDVIYSPSVTVYKDINYNTLDVPFQVNVITIPALRNPVLANDNKYSDNDREITRNKIRTIFSIAKKNKCETLILGAFGCGAHKNPPQEVALLFKDVIAEHEYRDCFRNIIFAILGDSNYNVFSQLLQPV